MSGRSRGQSWRDRALSKLKMSHIIWLKVHIDIRDHETTARRLDCSDSPSSAPLPLLVEPPLPQRTHKHIYTCSPDSDTSRRLGS